MSRGCLINNIQAGVARVISRSLEWEVWVARETFWLDFHNTSQFREADNFYQRRTNIIPKLRSLLYPSTQYKFEIIHYHHPPIGYIELFLVVITSQSLISNIVTVNQRLHSSEGCLYFCLSHVDLILRTAMLIQAWFWDYMAKIKGYFTFGVFTEPRTTRPTFKNRIIFTGDALTLTSIIRVRDDPHQHLSMRDVKLCW